jgi:hypothetical protein
MTPIPVFSFTSPAPSAVKYDPDAAVKGEFGRLIHAAIINTRFRETLLMNPVCAIEAGYMGESFQFSSDLKDRIGLIKAGTLEDFSTQIMRVVNTSSVSEMAVLQYQ